MQGIILAAGRGSRLKRFTDNRPKCLNTVGNIPILECQLSALKSSGVDEIIIVTGYKAQMLETFSCRTIHNPDWEKTNMVVSLLHAESEFNQPAIVSYSDIIYGKDIVSQLVKQENDIVVVYDQDWEALWKARFANPLEDAESFRIDTDGRIKDIGRKVQSKNEIRGQYTGLMRFSSRAFSWIKSFSRRLPKDTLNKIDMTTMPRSLIQEEYPIYGMAIRGGWCEIDTIEDLELANQLYEKGVIRCL